MPVLNVLSLSEDSLFADGPNQFRSGAISNSLPVIHSHPQLFHKRSTAKQAPDGRSRNPLFCQRF